LKRNKDSIPFLSNIFILLVVRLATLNKDTKNFKPEENKITSARSNIMRKINILNILKKNIKNIPDDTCREFYDGFGFCAHVFPDEACFELMLDDDLLDKKISILVFDKEIFNDFGYKIDGNKFDVGSYINNMEEIVKNITIK